MVQVFPALAGGVLIGIAALLLYAGIGRIAGISGITFRLLDPTGTGWRLPFIAGLVGGAWIALTSGAPLPAAPMPGDLHGTVLLALSGLIVGFGTRLGNGCTSGHGICGLSRLSLRSLVAVVVFMGVGIIAATFLRGAL